MKGVLDNASIWRNRRLCSVRIQSQISKEFQGVKEQPNSKYLGLPLFIGRSKKEIFSYVLDNVKKKIGSWKNKFLSNAGKEVLIKPVLMALPVYCMSCFKLPLTICQDITKCIAKFWWCNQSTGKGMHWM